MPHVFKVNYRLEKDGMGSPQVSLLPDSSLDIHDSVDVRKKSNVGALVAILVVADNANTRRVGNERDIRPRFKNRHCLPPVAFYKAREIDAMS